jgi:hypothetical protein
VSEAALSRQRSYREGLRLGHPRTGRVQRALLHRSRPPFQIGWIPSRWLGLPERPDDRPRIGVCPPFASLRTTCRSDTLKALALSSRRSSYRRILGIDPMMKQDHPDNRRARSFIYEPLYHFPVSRDISLLLPGFIALTN